MTFLYLGPWREYMAKEDHYNMECNVHRLAAWALPNIFLISKTILSKDEVLDAIIRFGRIKLQYPHSIDYLAKQMSTEQKNVLKRVTLDDLDRNSTLTSQDLFAKIGRHMIYLRKYSHFYLKVPSVLLVEKKWEGYQFLEIGDSSKLALTPGKRSQTILFGDLVSRLRRWPGVDILIESKLTLTTDRGDRFVNDDVFSVSFSTKDWILYGWNDRFKLRLPQTLTKKFLDGKIREDGRLQELENDLRRWLAKNILLYASRTE